VQEIADKHGRMDGLIAAAGIQQEMPALEYSGKDVDYMMSINVTGVFMTAQAVARQMVRFGQGGSVVLIASMSGTIANRVCSPSLSSLIYLEQVLTKLGTHLPCLQRLQSCSHPTRSQSGQRMGPIRHQSKHDQSWLYRDGYGRGIV
jgi:hypothetical protein